MANVEPIAPTIDFEVLLTPIAGDNPAGEPMQYSGLYDEIREARRADDTSVSYGAWQTELKVADFRKVVELATTALSTQTKDLQIAVWLTEALTGQYGFAGFRDGLQLIRRLEEDFWDTLYPEIDEGDMEARANAIDWMNTQKGLTLSLKKFR
ncbi:MAG: type VI secretion system protein TssA [Blastocatellia bacterium]|nr:type VI secretion system protein TssA [Blastocatellia bacterium]